MRAHRFPQVAVMAAFFVALTLLAVPQPSAGAASCPEVIAHRAGTTVAPENTAVGITMSAQSGAPTVEMDVRWTYGENTESVPGYPVLMHDPSVDRTTNGTGAVDSTTWGLTKITRLSAADYAPWKTDPRFGGFRSDGSLVTPVAWAGTFVPAAKNAGVDMLLDVKVTPGEWAARKLMQYVDQHSWREHTRYMGSYESLKAFHGWFPDVVGGVIEYPPAGRAYQPSYLKAVGASFYAVPFQALSGLGGTDWVTYLHAQGLRVYVWTSDSATWDVAANWQAAASAGVDAVITNEPAAAIAAFGC